MSEATQGSTVHVHYTGRTEDGTVFDSSADRDPLSFELGSGRVIPGFESAVEGMQIGDEKTVTIPSTDAYGPRRDELIHEVGREQLPPDLSPEVGQHLHLRTPDGQTMQVQVVEVGDESIALDANHPLAGKDLTFEIELVGVE
ncbi:MAG: peptidylprolyl isomerase [Gemmatimonadales bacterium]|nr:MAG: peptidylprolyl isomerase [Gemmatimonadales bacterium]